MDGGPQFLLIGVVVAVGVLHTIVPNHWLPTALLTWQQGAAGDRWTAARAGFGHVLSTMLIGSAVWLVGAALRSDLARWSTSWRAFALVAFGAWIALTADIRRPMRLPSSSSSSVGKRPRSFASCGGASSPISAGPALTVGAVLTWHTHLHRAGRARIGWGTDVAAGFERDPPLHEHSHQSRRGTRLVLIVGSSPIVEDIPAFFAAGE